MLPHTQDLSSKIALFSVAAIGQHEILFQTSLTKRKAHSLISLLVSIDPLYESLGGIVGYQLHALTLLLKNGEQSLHKEALFAQGEAVNLSHPSEDVVKDMMAGISAIREMGEIFPIGGLGSRLNLISKRGEPLPAACLPFCGRTLLEGLVRDVQAREFLYYRLYNRQVTVPIAMMTSLEKRNDRWVRSICESKNWFGRPCEYFLLFPQISVPVITEEGKWSMKTPTELNLQPGGHGALWKAAEEQGVFLWFQSLEKNHLLIRQINNPISGTDYGLLALVGHGKRGEKAFGFASCQRLPQAAEGVLVLIEAEGKRRLSNIEYTDFKRYAVTALALNEAGELRPCKHKYSLRQSRTDFACYQKKSLAWIDFEHEK